MKSAGFTWWRNEQVAIIGFDGVGISIGELSTEKCQVRL
jgi:hypothetical protein